MKKHCSYLLLAFLFLNACSSSKKVTKTNTTSSSAANIIAGSNANTSITNDGKIWASLWQQRAAEYRALCFQAYNIAKQRVDEGVKKVSTKPLAIVTDIDETLLDNSPYDAAQGLKNQDYSDKTWKQWTDKAQADTVPGAPAFFKYAASKGITIYYITNRNENERGATLYNLQKYAMPNANDEHLFLKNGNSSKEERRQEVLKTHEILLLCGDNLPDFDMLYDNHPTEANRTAITQKLQKEFGSRYIVIPNPSYGDFEGALFQYNYKLSPAQKDSIIRAKVKADR
ncbi:5'-nucleotidase, lipoprotein e(P4) family [Mucilaginibacter lappiensis]|uniref:5'-nucleotidase (Lipoprotein e(P4) family) n=1 Tax=Mucilaginibacter lappiensis TaxID=354630 RepID=A0ABR6PR03_9SPHI|nr:5'-nucleotidase, lipoprotein e(P4) family [Mucilaginibacter lappiensis]MBB6112193.1 5'-nucleotidase (lipoprotein e(P4) family) [Mucilaginibacter lappiensis]SIR99024.1 5'-nucleotidase, lipoprotein e(P4) family [Mucilaginibacter lappiensis]